MIRTCFAVVALLAPSALADVSFTFEGTTLGKAHTTTMQFKGKRALITMVGKDDGRNSAVLRDGEGKRTLVFDHAGKAYVELSDAKAAEMKARAAASQEGLSAKVAGLPPDKRAQLEAMMPKAPGAAPAAPKKFTFEKKGKSRKVAGYSCDDYVVKLNDAVDGEGCFIAWKDAGITREQLREQLLAAMEGLPGAGDSFDTAMTAEAGPGVPAWRKRVGPDGAVLSESTLKKLSTDSLAASVFEVPKGYTARTVGRPGAPPPGMPPMPPSSP